MNNYVLLKIISVLIAAVSQILLKISADKEYPNRIREYLNVFVIVGYGMFFISAILSVVALRGITISLSSIIEALSYIVVPILSYFILKERISKSFIIGTVIILIGFFVYYL